MCTSFGRPARPTGIWGESTSLPNVRSLFRCRRLNSKVTGVFKKALTSRALLELRKYSEFAQKIYGVQRWIDLKKLAASTVLWIGICTRSQTLLYADGHVVNFFSRPSYMLTVMLYTCFQTWLNANRHVVNHFLDLTMCSYSCFQTPLYAHGNVVNLSLDLAICSRSRYNTCES